MVAGGALLTCVQLWYLPPVHQGVGESSGSPTTKVVTMSQSTVTKSSSSSSSVSGSDGPPPKPSVTRIVQEYPIPNGQAVKTTQVINGQGISGVTETMQITQVSGAVGWGA